MNASISMDSLEELLNSKLRTGWSWSQGKRGPTGQTSGPSTKSPPVYVLKTVEAGGGTLPAGPAPHPAPSQWWWREMVQSGAPEMAHSGCCLAASSGVTGFPWLTPQPGSESQKRAPGWGTQSVLAHWLLKLCLHFQHCLPPQEGDCLQLLVRRSLPEPL